MRISRRADYALRVLFTLVEEDGRRPVSIRELAERNNVPKPFLEHIMLDLKKQAWVTSLPGKRGGYVLARSPAEITMGQVVRFFDGLLSPISCVSISHFEPCTQEASCRFRRVFLQVRNDVARYMDNATLASVFAQSIVQREEVFTDAYMNGAGI